MKSFDDAFGHMLYDHLTKFEGPVYGVIEREDGLVDVDDPQTYFAVYGGWPAHQRQAMSFVQGRVLDVGCGAGRHALYLQDLHPEVVGIDESPLAVEVCRLRGLADVRRMSVSQLSYATGQFDTILMLGNNFGLFANLKRARRLLRRFYGLTSDGAKIIGETLDPYQTTDAVHLEYHEFNRERGRAPGQVRIRIRYRKWVNPWFDYLFVSRDEMEQVLEGTGWKVEQFLDSSDARYVAVIEKDTATPRVPKA